MEGMVEVLSRFKGLGEAENRAPVPRFRLSHLGSAQTCLCGMLGHEARDRQVCRVLQAKHSMMGAIGCQAPGRDMEITFPLSEELGSHPTSSRETWTRLE